jgi:hypothetical protein
MARFATWLLGLLDRLREQGGLPASFYEEARRRTWLFLGQAHVLGG